MKKNKLLLIGWDAADWKVIGPLLAKGQMPTLKKLIDNGVYGNMSTMNPPFSPMLWTSVATGKTADKHGILGFVEPTEDKNAIRPITSKHRKTRALWNIFHHNNLKSNIVGWWPTYPVEPIHGAMVADTFKKVSVDPKKQKELEDDVVYPKSLKSELKDLRMFPFEITKEHILPFIPNAKEVDQEKNNGLAATAKIISENVSIHNAATRLLRTTDWDFTAIYYDLIDHFCHAYMKFHPPKLNGISKTQYEIYKDAVNGAYRFQDMLLDRTLQLVDDDTTVIIMSDHGFESGHKRLIKMPKVQAAAAIDHRQFGMFVASGPNIKKKEKMFGLGLIDIAPTILHHFKLPVGRDMDGKVATEIFKDSKRVEYIDSWDKIKGDFGERKDEEGYDILSDQESMQQLIDLGYIEKPDEKIETAIRKTECDLQHNLARVYLGKKDYQSAKKILLELIKEPEPIDTAPYYMNLITISLSEKDFEQAEKYIEIVKKSSSEVSYNYFFIESSIYLGKRQPKKALNILEEAIENQPRLQSNAEFWYRLARIKHQISRFKEAHFDYEKAIEIEPDRAKFHTSMAENLIALKNYEEAAEYAFTAIELVKYYPKAHFILGTALEKLGHLESAKQAFETAAKLKPKTYDKYHKAEQALENVEEKLKYPELKDRVNNTYKENQIVVVSGLPRSGTSLMMQMLDKAGEEALVDGKREADSSNPKGYFEYEPVMSLHKDNSWLEKAQNKSVKIVAPLLKHLDEQYRYKIIFMKRDLDEVVKSQQKMVGKNQDTIPINLYNAYIKQLEAIENWKEKQPGVDLIYVDYKELFSNPEEQLDKVEQLLGKKMNKLKMADCIDPALYRNKSTSVKK